MKRTLIFILTILLLAASAQAAMVVNKHTNDFSVTSPYSEDVKACACENRAEPVTVVNTGGFYSSYRVSLITDQPDWFSHSLSEFTLAPGEERTFLVYAQPPCGTVGDYTYAIKVASGYGRERILTRNVAVKQCQNIYLTVAGPNESNLCQPMRFNVTLKNVAEFADSYRLDLGSFNDHAVFESGGRDTYLAPDEERRMDITITAPCSLYGDITIPFIVTSEKNQVTERRDHEVAIENQFDHEITTETQQEICSRVESTYTFSVKNLIDVPNTYDVIITGAGFMDYEPKTLTLAGNESEDVVVKLNPGKGDVGDHTLRIRVVSDLGDIRKTRDVELDVFDCYAYEVGFVEMTRASDGGYDDQACCGEKTYTLNVRNAGQTPETYSIDVDGPTWFSPEEKTIRLAPSENRNVEIRARLPCTDERYEFPVTVALTKYPEISETVLIRVESQTQQTCHAVESRVDRLSIDEEDTIVPFLVRHVGLEGGVYTVSLDGELYNGTLEREITLEPGEEKVIHLQTRANLTDYFDGKYLSSLNLTYAELDITYTEPFWTRLSHVSWFTKLWRSIVEYDYGSITPCMWVGMLLVLLIIAGIALLVRSVRRRPEMGGRTAAIAVIAVLLAAVALALFLVPLPSTGFEPVPEVSDDVVLEWYENDRLTIDLSEYFTDADNDVLEYTATQSANVAIRIDGSEATFIPERNWAGEERVVFTASDQKGGVTDSPLITLRVVRREQLSFLQWWGRYCRHINLVLIAALLALLLAAALFARRRAEPALPPPQRPESTKAVHTVATKDGTVRRLGEAAPAVSRKRRRKAARKAAKQTTALVPRPGQTLTYVDPKGKKQVLGVAERIEWPEPAKAGTTVDKGATVNIAVGTHAPGKAAEPSEVVFVGAKQGNKVHDPACVVAQRIVRKKRVAFTTKAEALKAGYGPCKICQPFKA